MPALLNPYLTFTDSARAAMEFYRSVFGGDLSLTTFSEFGMGDGPIADLVMHAALETPQGFTLMASDSPPEMGMPASSGTWVSLSGDADASDDLRGWFAALADGGTVQTELAVQVWGDEFGQLTDRFGTGWMVNLASAGGE